MKEFKGFTEDVDLQWFSDEQPIEQSVESAKSEAMAEVGGEGPFHSWGEGKDKMDFKTRDDLNKYLKDSSLRTQDYTKKSQQRESEYKQRQSELEKEREDFNRQFDVFRGQKSKYDKWEEGLKRRPHIAQQIDRLISTPSNPNEVFERSQSYADEKYSALEEKLKALEADRERERLERERDGIYSRMGERYDGFDPSVVNDALDKLETGNLEPLIEMVYRSSMYNPAEIQAKVENNLRSKQKAKLMPSGGGGSPSTGKGSTDPKVAREEAMAAYGVE